MEVFPRRPWELDEGFFPASARRTDSRRSGVPGGRVEVCRAADDVDSASCEVERARCATHSAIALRSAATAGDSEAATVTHDVGDVQGSVMSQSPRVLEALGFHEQLLGEFGQGTRAHVMATRW